MVVQYTALPLDGVLVTWYGRIFYTYTFWCNFDTVFSQFLETRTSDRCLKDIVQFSGFSLCPLLFFIYSPFIKEYNFNFKSIPDDFWWNFFLNWWIMKLGIYNIFIQFPKKQRIFLTRILEFKTKIFFCVGV